MSGRKKAPAWVVQSGKSRTRTEEVGRDVQRIEATNEGLDGTGMRQLEVLEIKRKIHRLEDRIETRKRAGHPVAQLEAKLERLKASL